MALSERDQVRLHEIEHRLTDADPALGRLFGRWDTAGQVAAGWSPLPVWMLVVFVVASVGWTVSAPMGAIAGILGTVLAVARARATPRERSRREGDGAD